MNFFVIVGYVILFCKRAAYGLSTSLLFQAECTENVLKTEVNTDWKLVLRRTLCTPGSHTEMEFINVHFHWGFWA
jgi:hypothetical protein